MMSRFGMTLAVGCVLVLVSASAVAQNTPAAQTPAQTPAPATKVDPSAKPKMVIEPEVFDFGEVWEGAPAKGEFTIKNVGDAPLTIKSRTSCGCTVATKPKSPLAPGEETIFTVSYRTNHMGRANKKVILTTNDPAQPRVDVPVRGLVKAMFEKTPGSAVLFRDLGVTSEESSTVRLKNKYDKPVKLKLSQEQSYGQYNYELKELVEGQEYELTVSTKPPLKEGRNAGRAVLETDVADVPKLTISVNGTVPRRLSVRPATILMSPSMKQASERTIRVQYRADEPLNITSIETTPKLEYEIIPPADTSRNRATKFYQVRLMMPAFDEIPDSGAKVVIVTDDKTPEFQRIEVPIQKRQRYQAQNPTQQRGRPVTQSPTKRSDLRDVDPDEIRRRIEEAVRQQQAAKESGNKPKPAEPGEKKEQKEG
jgi:hypothetical protein